MRNSPRRTAVRSFLLLPSARTVAVALLALAVVSACDAHDDHIPMSLKGMNAWVHDRQSEKELYAGFVEGTYFDRDRVLAQCASLAAAAAAQHHLKEWGYVCCTATTESECATKVR